jgi:hypothetical protein
MAVDFTWPLPWPFRTDWALLTGRALGLKGLPKMTPFGAVFAVFTPESSIQPPFP